MRQEHRVGEKRRLQVLDNRLNYVRELANEEIRRSPHRSTMVNQYPLHLQRGYSLSGTAKATTRQW